MTDHYHIIYAQEAVDDLRSIYAYIAYELKEPDIALKQINHVRKAIRLLDTMPSRYALVDWEPWKSRNTHKMPVDHYVVYYMANSETMTVTVLGIFYNRQNVKNILKSE